MHIVALMQQPGGYGVGVSMRTPISSKRSQDGALAALTDGGTVGVIETKWLGTALDLSSTPLTAGATKSTDAGATVASKTRKTRAKARTLTGTLLLPTKARVPATR